MQDIIRGFFKPNKFKVIFSIVFIITTLLVFLVADALHSRILENLFAVLYFPALVFAWNFQFLPVFKKCSISFGETLCVYDQTVAVRLGDFVFILYVYTLSCFLYLLKNKIRNRRRFLG